MIKYKANKHDVSIKEIEVVSETKKTVKTSIGLKQLKVTQFYDICDSYQEAKQAIIDCRSKEVKGARERLELLTNLHNKALKL